MAGADDEKMRIAQAAMQAYAQGDRNEAARLARTLLVRDVNDPNANQILGAVALEAGDAAAARRHLERANAATPNRPQILNTLGIALRRCGEINAARKMMRRAGELGLADAWRNLGNLEGAEGNADAAIAAYRAALALRDDPRTHGALAEVLEHRHDLAGARRHAESALALDPNYDIARIALAQVHLRERDYAAVLAAVAPVVSGVRGSPTNQAIAWGLIGEAHDRSGAPHEAFAAFSAANRLLLAAHGDLRDASHLPYHPDGVARMARFVEAADVSAWARPEPSTLAPVFLIGFPRSGTTLLDQVLSSHSGIVCLEEKEIFANALGDALRSEDNLAALGRCSGAELAGLREAYWTRAEVEIGGRIAERQLVDKLPLNLIFLPLIRVVFPDAKIIFALRDPRDVILSCFQQRFGMNAAMVQFLELESAARYYDAVMRLFELTRDRLGVQPHVVRYEDVVADLEGVARGLASYLEIPFEPAMLNFRETAMKREIDTPSARQVIQPLYTRSVGRWRAYAEELAPVLPVLTPWAKRFGYE